MFGIINVLFLNHLFDMEFIKKNKNFNEIFIQRGFIKVYLLYWILFFNYFSIFLIITICYCEFYFFFIKLNVLSWFMVLVVLLVSSSVIINSIDYLSIMESYLFLVYIYLFQFSMNVFTLSNDLIITFPNRELIGLISYLLINFLDSVIIQLIYQFNNLLNTFQCFFSLCSLFFNSFN